LASEVDRYWEEFVDSVPEDRGRPSGYVEAFFFGAKPDGARAIAELVLEGAKTATGSVLWSYEADGKPLPEVGDHWIVTGGENDPLCVIRTVEVRVIPFDEVGEEYARDGGEDDRSLESWRRMYWDYIVSECRRIGREPSEKAPLVMERFEVVHRG
jgi:uncharacterized protein YhfF